MPQVFCRAVFAATILAGFAFGQSSETKTAEQVYKNITQLKGTPAAQLLPAMTFIAASLGVECTFCHVENKMELDEKPAKKTAREMMAMMASLNKNSFGGQMEVTCYSCHHGAEHPAATPPVLQTDGPPHPEAAPRPASATAPTADDIVARYLTAMGGADAIRKFSSRVQKGKILTGGGETPIEVITKAPNKRISITHMGSGESYTAFDGTSGWLGSTGRPAREMSAAESQAAGLDAEFSLALRLKEIFPQMRRARQQEIAGVMCDTLIATRPGQPPVRFYFDSKTGLLVRTVRLAETPVGRNPTQIDYADYRTVDGVTIPFRWTLARPNGRFTIQITDVQNNVPVDDSRFTKPDGPVK